MPEAHDNRVGTHYSQNVKWRYIDEEEKTNVAVCFYQFVNIARELEGLNLSVPPGLVVEWQKASGWAEREQFLEDGAWQALDSAVGNLSRLSLLSMSEAPYGGTREVRDGERRAWPTESVLCRPSMSCIIDAGVVEQVWIDYIQGLVTAFRNLKKECREKYTEIPRVRTLLFRGFFLCMDLLYICRMLEYAWHLHGSENDNQVQLPEWLQRIIDARA